MEDLELTFDVRGYQFVHPETGYVLYAESVMMNEDNEVIEKIYAGTGIKVGESFIEMLRNVIEGSESKYPW